MISMESQGPYQTDTPIKGSSTRPWLSAFLVRA
jgi:hypothetical protein